jgi:hypothetical protein
MKYSCYATECNSFVRKMILGVVAIVVVRKGGFAL